MQYLYKYYKFNESEETSSEEVSKRSERLLTQAQKENDLVVEKPGPFPTILFTDVVGSSKMWSDDALTMSDQLKDHHKLIQNLSSKYNGWIVKTIGDAFMVYFEPTDDSLLNALKFSKKLILDEKKYNLRIGICRGHMQEETYVIQKVNLRDFYGNPVNTASRMESKVAGDAGYVAFSDIKGIGENEKSIISRKIGKLEKIDLSLYDLKGAVTKEAFRIKIK